MITYLIFAFLIFFETDDCFISFIELDSIKYVVKQIKDPTPEEQFLLILDALGCHIAENTDIPMNKVTIIPSNAPFIGKSIIDRPATLHTLAPGISTDKECRYQNINLHQRFRKRNSPMWQQWGSLAPEKTGLTLEIIQNMGMHKDLPKIVALDTFAGNADRSAPNLFYDCETDRFCGIDMAASFSSPLAEEACRQLIQLKDQLTTFELNALKEYAATLKSLLESWPPEKQEQILLKYCKIAGLEHQDVSDRIEFHKRNIKVNYQYCLKLLKEITGLDL